MAPPASAMLAGAAAVTGAYSVVCFTGFSNLNFFFCWSKYGKSSYQIACCYLGKLLFSYYPII